MKKIIGIGVAAGFAMVAVLACSSGGGQASSSSSSGGGGTDAGPDVKKDAPVVVPDAGTCYDDTNAKAFATAPPAKGQNKCTGTMVADFLAACLGSTGSQQKCDEFLKGTGAAGAGTKACGGCLLGPNQAGDDPKTFPQPVLISVGDSVFLNGGMCDALAVGAPGDCADKAGNEAICLLTTCETCETADRAGCINDSAAKEPCKSALNSDACNNAVKAAQATADAKCGASGATFEQAYALMGAFICGAP